MRSTVRVNPISLIKQGSHVVENRPLPPLESSQLITIRGTTMLQTKSDSEQRIYPRIPKEVSVSVAKLEYPLLADADQSGTLKNIAEGGICFITAASYEPGARLSLKINIKGWRRHLKSVASILEDVTVTAAATPLTAVAEVTWVSPQPNGDSYEIGVKFLDIYEDEYNALKKYLENLANYSAAS